MGPQRILELVIMLFALLPYSGNAQVQSLPDLLELGKKNYPSIKARSSEVQSSVHAVRTSALDYMPKLTIQHQYTYGTSNSVTGAFYPNPAVVSPSGGIRTENSYVATWGSITSAMMEWSVFNFGKVAANVKASKANLEVSKASLSNEIFQHQIKIADSYLLALVTDKLVSIQEANLERAKGFRDMVAAGVRSGLRAGVDSSLASVEYAKAEIQLMEIQRSRSSQHLRLAELVGGNSTDVSSLDSMEFFSRLPIGVDAGAAVATSGHPTLRVFEARRNATDQGSIAIRRTFLPSITLVGAAWARGSGVSNNDDSFNTDFQSGTRYQVSNYLLGLAVRWTLSDYAAIHQRYKSEQYLAVRDQELLNEQEISVDRQLKESRINYEVAMQKAKTAPIALRAARLAFDQAQARYKSGLADLPTFLQSLVVLSEAEADLAMAYSNAWRSLLAIAAAKGEFSVFLLAFNR